jgi:hypothetical protein
MVAPETLPMPWIGGGGMTSAIPSSSVFTRADNPK